MSEPRSRAGRLYSWAMGTGDSRLVSGQVPTSDVRLRDVVYYSYHRGFWPLIRGSLYRLRLGKGAGRLFLGRRTQILFPGRLSLGRNVALGDHLYMNCYGRNGVSIGSNVRVREFGWIQVTSHLPTPGEGLTIGDDTYVGPHCVLGAGGGIRIGRGVTIGAYVHLLAENHVFEDTGRPVSEQGVRRSGIDVGDGCWIGNAALILDGVQVGEHAVIGAGSVVTKSVAARTVVAGNPARKIRDLV